MVTTSQKGYHMKKVRVKLSLRPEDRERAPDYLKEFEGMKGTVVYSTGDSFQVAVELDKPHSVFGKFCSCAYVLRRSFNDVIATLEDMDAFRKLAKRINGQWRAFHDKQGDPLPWSEVAAKIADGDRLAK
jgi:hypothetical protein